MTTTVIVCVSLGVLLALGWWERRSRDAAHRRVRIRVHVNGTRGKSTVTRLIAAVLREAGVRTVAKTTGTAARLILPDGTEQPVRRRAPASIREQLWVVRQARALGADALVVECMAIDPALQRTSERDMIRATIGVITNARPDHADVMGSTPAEVAAALAQSVPDRGVVVLGHVRDDAVIERRARACGTRVVRADTADPALDALGLPAWQRENAAIALTVARELGVAAETARRALAGAPEDPGAVTRRTQPIAGRPVTIVDARAANDPESLQLILDGAGAEDGCLFVFNHRADRPLRLRQFVEAPIWKRPGTSVLMTGHAADCVTSRFACRALGPRHAGFAAPRRLARALRDRLAHDPDITTVVFCGNAKHLDVDTVVGGEAGA